jgi:hypothetical protein
MPILERAASLAILRRQFRKIGANRTALPVPPGDGPRCSAIRKFYRPVMVLTPAAMAQRERKRPGSVSVSVTLPH